MIEVYEIINGCIPLINDNFFIFRENKKHNLRNFQIILNKTKIKKVRYSFETISYRTSLLCANFPNEYKLVNSLSEFI